MNHSFSVEIATEYGVETAVILQHFYYWIEKNIANKVNFHDGNYWTYNSSKALSEIFPYIKTRTMNNILKRMEEDGLILIGNYNKLAYDRTKWYALTDKAFRLLSCTYRLSVFANPLEEISNPLAKNSNPLAKFANGSAGICQPIPNINTYSNTNINTDIKPPLSPKKKKSDKDLIQDQWNRLDDHPNLKEKIEEWVQYKEERKEGYKPQGFRAFISLVLNQRAQYNDIQIMEVIDYTMASGYKGIVWDRLSKPQPTKQNKSKSFMDIDF